MTAKLFHYVNLLVDAKALTYIRYIFYTYICFFFFFLSECYSFSFFFFNYLFYRPQMKTFDHFFLILSAIHNTIQFFLSDPGVEWRRFLLIYFLIFSLLKHSKAVSYSCFSVTNITNRWLIYFHLIDIKTPWIRRHQWRDGVMF